MNDIATLDATALADLVRTKQVKPTELLDAAIDRAEKVNPQINAIVTPMYDLARKAAEGPIDDKAPFCGVPFLMKDLGPTYAGVRMTMATAFLKDFVPPIDSVLTTRQKAAGLIIFGKTNTPEFGIVPTTEPHLFGPARNPWNLDHSTGGSSGGSAAAVAAGVIPIAHANDGGGSIRIPASCCGLFGLKPTRARITHAPLFGDIMGGLVNDHAVSRTVRDSAALLDATAGGAPGDPYPAPPQERPYVEEVGTDPGHLRIGFTATSTTDAPLHEEAVNAVEDAAKLCEELGHEVVEATLPISGDELIDSFTMLWAAGNASGIDGIAQMTGGKPAPDQFEPLTWALYEMGKEKSAADYLDAVFSIQTMARVVAGFQSQYDLWLTPTLASPPPPIGYFDAPEGDPMAPFQRAIDYVPFTAIQNATGQPAMSVPLYWTPDGLPLGAHFAASYGDEPTLFRIAAQLEEARPWANKRPPTSAV